VLNSVSNKICSPSLRATEVRPRVELAASPTQTDTFRASAAPLGSLTLVKPKVEPTFSAQKAVCAATEIVNSASPKTAPRVDIKDVQAGLTSGLPDLKIDFLHTDPFTALNGRLATETELTAMIESLQEESRIPFGYITDGCYARAHLMDESFRQHGINYAKMFVRGDLAAQNQDMQARWWYHVAPLVFVDDGQGNPEAKIIDPGFSDKPMDPTAWVEAMTQGPSIQVDLVDPEQYYPRRRGKPETFSESLPPAVRRLQSYARKLHDHREAAGQDLGDFVKPTWDKPGSGGDFTIDGVTKNVFPEGVHSARGQIYFGNSQANLNGTLVELEFPEAEIEVSAAWENRPSDFDPYAV